MEQDQSAEEGHGRRSTISMVESEEGTRFELTVDEVVEGYVGSLGLSQILHVLVVSFAWIFDAQSTLVTIFSDAQPPSWRCKNGFSCGHGGGSGSVCGLVPGSWEWVGGDRSSTIAEWGLICDRKFLAAVPASVNFLGSLLGSALFGHLADTWLGRKRAVMVSCILTSITFFATSYSPNIYAYAFFRFATGFARSGIGISCLVLATECVGRKWRGQAGQYSFFFFTIGFLSLPLVAYPTRTNWRNLYKFLSILPLAYAVLLLPWVSESPRWLLIRGRSKEALKVLKKFAKTNGKDEFPENLTLANPSEPKDEEGSESGSVINQTNSNKKENLWTTKWAAKRMVLVMIAGFGVGFVYYGVQLNVENLNFNLYVSVAINAVMEIPAVFAGSFLLGFANRRLLFSVSSYMAGVSCILCIIFSSKGYSNSKDQHRFGGNWGQLIIEAIGFMCSSLAYDILYIYCVELFPTNVRNFAVSMLRQTLMLGASVAPLLVVVGRLSPSVSFIVFGVLSIVSGVLSIWIPETRNAPLYETLKQQEEMETLNHVSNGGHGRCLEFGN